MFSRLFIFSLLLLTVNLFCDAGAQAASVLTAINRSDETSSLQLFFHLDPLPSYRLKTNGRRVDLELDGTSPRRQLQLPETDGRMIKIVPKELPAKSIFSIYFRYPPQKVDVHPDSASGVLLVDVLLGNQLSAKYPELTTKLQGVDVIKRSDIDSLNPVNLSPYAKNWITFFTTYELPVSIKTRPLFHLPPFPLAQALAPEEPLDQWLSEEVRQRARENKWNQVCLLLREAVNTPAVKESIKERLVLAYAEALLRMGEYRDPYFLLQRIMIQYPGSLLETIANYLLLYQQATRGNYIDTFFELRPLANALARQTPFADDIHLFLGELALMSKQYEDAEKLLADPVLSRNAGLNPLRLMRLADLRYAKGEKAKALTGYSAVINQTPSLADDPMSLAAFCDCLYTAKQYKEAAQWYMALSDLLNNQEHQDLALFRLAMCQLQMKNTAKKGLIDLEQIINAFPQAPGGSLAYLKKTDLDYVGKRITPDEARTIYGRCTAYGGTVLQREECLFKEALVHHFSGEQHESVDKCMRLLREFQGGELRTEAMALLIGQLPEVVKQLVDNQQYVKALVLAKQNKKYFVRGWLKPDLLFDLAKAYSKLGLADQAAQTYQYLFEVSDNAQKENIYLPLLEALFAAGRYVQVEEFANRYQLRYPGGRDGPAIFLLKTQALYRSGHPEQALKLITDEKAPSMQALELLKGRLYYENKQWQQVIDTLDTPKLIDRLAANHLLLPLAESYFQIGNDENAAKLFSRLLKLDQDQEQAQFRLAQIENRRGNSQQALKLFSQLAEKGKDPLWKRLAREERAILELQQ
nr:tetratricopeptide repeat protein [uncultured Desulfobulbus sp.]